MTRTTRYVCCDERRRAALLASGAPADLSGIDYLVVTQGATTADPTFIDIVLVKPLPLPLAALTPDNISISGGVRFPPPPVGQVDAVPPAGPVVNYRLTIAGNQPTDYSTYTLALVKSPSDDSAPDFIDPRLAAVDFSFKVDCPNDYDCAPDCGEPPGGAVREAEFDYRARDYDSLRRLLLDRVEALVPGFTREDAPDLTVALAEAAAYRLDQSSYRLDWIGTETFLRTARSRTSLARHARLVDYAIGEGASARCFASFRLGPMDPDGTELPPATPLLTRDPALPPVVPASRYRTILAAKPLVFETMAVLKLWSWRNEIAIHTWSDQQCVLPKGATSATLVDLSSPQSALAAGDFVAFVEIASPATGRPEDARRDRRQVVRLIRVTPLLDPLTPGKFIEVEWAAADALSFDLTVSAQLADALGAQASVVCALATANIMLCDHGASLPPASALDLQPADDEALRPQLDPPVPDDGTVWSPVLNRADLSRVMPAKLAATPQLAATTLLVVDPAACMPALQLDDDFAVWTCAGRDLLSYGPFDRAFVVETAMGGFACIRFGDNINGFAPTVATMLVPSGRFGFGPEGNIGADALAHVVVPDLSASLGIRVTNPLPASGGAAPEPASSIRIAAPQAFRIQDRAVCEADYAEVAMRHPDVTNALAMARWTGAWQTMLIYIDRKDGLPVDTAFRTELLAHLEHFRLMGFDVAVRGVKPAPLLVQMLVCARPDQLRSDVGAAVLAALHPHGPADGSPGFFHPDRFTFGAPLYLSQLVAAVMAVPGVQSVQTLKFQRLDRAPQNELALGVIRPAPIEALQLDDDPNFPERGKLVLQVGGGR